MAAERRLAEQATPGAPTRPGALERIAALDILRGVALLGMLLVHVNDRAIEAESGVGRTYQTFVSLFFDERFWTIFGILFGAGFAVQLGRADARGESLTARYLRRLGALAVIGLAAEIFAGFAVLFSYAIWGLPLLLLRRLSD